jgi:hypothetical protein
MGPYSCEQCQGLRSTDNDNHICDLCQAEIDAGIPGSDDGPEPEPEPFRIPRDFHAYEDHCDRRDYREGN